MSRRLSYIRWPYGLHREGQRKRGRRLLGFHFNGVRGYWVREFVGRADDSSNHLVEVYKSSGVIGVASMGRVLRFTVSTRVGIFLSNN